ncbi:hypothetical protein [Novipirellula caenicola]|uniref:Integral membrane protein n=1 Tax=Novipirellula caenicola TaxID=1536901 RepID=A0ABP9VKS0_9BACT
MKPLGIRDLMLLTAITAAHLAITKLAVDFRDNRLSLFVLLVPTSLTILIHRRLRLPLHIAAFIHYPVTLVWAFAYGVTYSFFWNRISHTFFEKSSVGLETPIHYGTFCVEVMAILGIVTSSIYAFAASKLSFDATTTDRRTM